MSGGTDSNPITAAVSGHKQSERGAFAREDVEKAIAFLRDRRTDIVRYCDLLQWSSAVNVEEDRAFRKAFTAFYRLRRNDAWRQFYFETFEDLKGRKTGISFEEIQLRLFRQCGQIESSFSSKMLATIDPEMPIWDSYVLKNLGLKLTGKNKEERFSRAVALYDDICRWYREFLKTEEAGEMLSFFDQAFPEFGHVTEVKKIDFIIWALR